MRRAERKVEVTTCESVETKLEDTRFSPREAQNWAARRCLMIFDLSAVFTAHLPHPDRGPSPGVSSGSRIEAEELEDSERGVGDSSPGVGRYRIRLAKPERRGSLNRRSEDSASSASFPWFSPLFCLHGTQHQPRGALNQGSSWLGRRVPALRRKRWRWRGVPRAKLLRPSPQARDCR